MRISKERLKELIKEELQNMTEVDPAPRVSNADVARRVIDVLRSGDNAEDGVLIGFIETWGDAVSKGSVGRNPRVLRLIALINQALEKFLADDEEEQAPPAEV
mgnify:CR=1 FL=1